jgi:type I restriction enzyme S subunit
MIYYNDLLDNEYAYFLTNSKIILRSITLKATATAQPKLNKDNVKEIRVPLPPISDQKNILEYLYKYTAMLNEGISRVEKEINLMHEFKKTLINNVVTGRVDIRKFKIPQFEYQSELNEPENASIIVDNNPDQIDLSTSDTME